MNDLLGAAIMGLVSGLFSAGAVWGVLKTEMRFLRRDVDEIRRKCLGIGECDG